MSPDEVEATEIGAATGYGEEAAASEKVVNVEKVVSMQDITEDIPLVTTAEAEGRGAAVVIIYASLEDKYCMKACGEALAPGSVYEGQTVRAAYRDLEDRCDFLIGTLYVLNHTDPVEAVGFREAAPGGARKVARVESVAPYIADSMEKATPGGPEIVWWMGCNPGQFPEAMYKLGKAHGENVLAVRGPVLTTNFNCNIKEVELESTEENIDEMKAEMSEKDLREALEDFIKNDPHKPLTYYNHVLDVPHPRGLTWRRKLRNLVDKLISTGSIVLRFTKSDLPKLDQEVLIKVIEHLEEPLEYYDYVPGVPHGADLYLPDADKLTYLAQILKRTGTIPYISYNADPGVRIAVPYWCTPQPVPLRELTKDEKLELTVGSQPKPPVEVRIRP